MLVCVLIFVNICIYRLFLIFELIFVKMCIEYFLFRSMNVFFCFGRLMFFAAAVASETAASIFKALFPRTLPRQIEHRRGRFLRNGRLDFQGSVSEGSLSRGEGGEALTSTTTITTITTTATDTT